MNAEDWELAGEIQKLANHLEDERNNLRQKKDRCACDTSGCCARHAAIYNYLGSSIVSLNWALADLRRKD